MKLKAWMPIALASVLVLSGVLAIMAMGLWQTESTKTPRKLAVAGDAATDVQRQTPTYDPADIRGSFTFGEISDLYQIPLEVLAMAFGVGEDQAASFQVKSLEALAADADMELGTASVRLFAACYHGLPYTPTEETYLPAKAVALLASNGQMLPEQAAYVAGHTSP